MPQKKKENDLYALKRKVLKEKRQMRARILGVDEVDGNTGQRVYTNATKTRRALKIEMFGSKSKSSKYGDDTSIEKFVEDCLVELKVDFVKQRAIKYINVDFFLPKYSAVIQTHGCYWHACSVCYPAGPKNNMQRKNIEKDKVANEIVHKSGYALIEIWEHEIEKEPDKIKEKLCQMFS